MDPSGLKRRLTCILAMDAVDYSRLVNEDETAALRLLAAHRAVIDGVIAYHGGRIANTAGDSVLAEFGSVVDAVRCAVEIQDALRERKRDALSAYLLSHVQPAEPPTRKWENTNDLYAYYLLDVEMCSCQLTSRLVQASGSVQLFVQRCFMGLEPDVVVDADGEDGDTAWRWWKWMRKYRVWEANRKVFLYPENCIQPELRDDKTPLFKRLETRLRQGEVTAESVERALAEYLDGLHEIARLEVMAVETVEEGYDEESELPYYAEHVVARTRWRATVSSHQRASSPTVAPTWKPSASGVKRAASSAAALCRSRDASASARVLPVGRPTLPSGLRQGATHTPRALSK